MQGACLHVGAVDAQEGRAGSLILGLKITGNCQVDVHGIGKKDS